MTRRFGRFSALLLIVLLVPAVSHAKVDPACGANATSAITGTVRNVKGVLLDSIRVEARQTNKSQVVASTTTGASGFYRLCVQHDTYDVRATDLSSVYATANQGVSTFSDFSSDVGFALEYKLNVTITPNAISVPQPGNTKLVEWIVRSKAPSATPMRLTLEHRESPITMAFFGTEFGGPSQAGGWNLWKHSETLSHGLAEGMYFAEAAGYDGASRVTEIAKDPYLIDNKPPRFGPPGGAGSTSCDGNPPAGPFSPAQTTNPFALISVGVCDPVSGSLADNGSSSLNPYTLQIEVWDPNGAVVTSGTRILNQLTAQYLPAQSYQLGTYKFRYTIKDNAGNSATSSLFMLEVQNIGGSVPVISGPQPGNLGENANAVVIGTNQTTPMSLPWIAFQARDADGQQDLSAGSLRVRVYGPDAKTLVYDYDVRTAPCPKETPGGCPRSSGYFNQGTGRFEASGFPLAGKPSGVYVVSASIEDHGGNATTLTWRFILGAAI